MRNVVVSILMITVIFIVSCEKAVIKAAQQSPVAVFESLWSTMDIKYALFSYKKIDWREVYRKYRPMVSDKTSTQELFDICSDMLDQLTDGHVALINGEQKYTYNGYYNSYPHNFSFGLLKEKYLPDVSYQGIMAYTFIDKLGYLHIPSFGEELTLPDIDRVFEKLVNVQGLIIDVRDNSGGGSLKVDRIVEKLIAEKMLLKYDIYKRGPGHDDFYPPEAKYLSPKNNILAGKPIVVLTNKRCFSSCNDFVLYMSELPNVVVTGDQTGGGGGTPFDYELPNGWVLKYSASMAVSVAGVNIEDGVAPDYFISNSLDDESNGRDAIFKFALEHLQ
ncbi:MULTISPECIES: S41 family peptidase [unclassified Chitinophaga]|uniref:S41 family peptidase n=1 Tax=unclassified Chitinophaga TaxID=2619133 RepID=UPI0030102F7C